LIDLYGLIDAPLLDKALGPIQLFDNVHAHAGSGGFLGEVATADSRIAILTSRKHYIPLRLRVPNGSRIGCSIQQFPAGALNDRNLGLPYDGAISNTATDRDVESRSGTTVEAAMGYRPRALRTFGNRVTRE
jgi:hypothetical protein